MWPKSTMSTNNLTSKGTKHVINLINDNNSSQNISVHANSSVYLSPTLCSKNNNYNSNINNNTSKEYQSYNDDSTISGNNNNNSLSALQSSLLGCGKIKLAQDVTSYERNKNLSEVF